MTPTISVVIPTYNSAPFIRETLASILSQTEPLFEVIISDDGSTDNTVAVVEEIIREVVKPAVRILKNTHGGPGAARNAGIKAAQGDWIAFIDSDDKWTNEKIARVKLAMKQNPEVNFFCHDQYHRFLNGKEERLNLAKRYRMMIPAKQLFYNCPFATSAVVCRKDILLKHGLFNETLLSAQDYELWLRLLPSLRPHFIDEVLGWYIDRRGNISSSKRWRYFKNVLWALWHNRQNTKIRWYLIGMVRLVVIFCKEEFKRLAKVLQ